MISDLEIQRAAAVLVERHREQAEEFAIGRARTLLADQDTEGASVWIWIAKAIAELQKLPARGEPQHRPGRFGVLSSRVNQ